MNRLRELRAGKYTQADMARLLGVGRTTYTKYENGDIRLTGEVLEKLARIFDVSVDAILGGAEDDDLWAYREAIRRDPERRMLFSLAKDGSIEDVRRAVAVIDALRRADRGPDDDPA